MIRPSPVRLRSVSASGLSNSGCSLRMSRRVLSSKQQLTVEWHRQVRVRPSRLGSVPLYSANASGIPTSLQRRNKVRTNSRILRAPSDSSFSALSEIIRSASGVRSSGCSRTKESLSPNNPFPMKALVSSFICSSSNASSIRISLQRRKRIRIRANAYAIGLE